MDARICVAMVGLGYWGPNVLRSFHEMPDVYVKCICDLDLKKLKKYTLQYPQLQSTQRYVDVLDDPQIEGVVIATSAESHFELALQALKANKHVFVEKPLTLNLDEAYQLVRLAKQRQKKLMVGHLLMYHPAVEYMKRYMQSDDFGDLRYIYTTRVNLGKARCAENALWSLAPHDVSLILYLTAMNPEGVEAQGESYLRNGVEDVVFCTMRFLNKVMAHIHVSWLDPHKVRKMTIVGSKKMLVFDDMQLVEKIKIYDKSFVTHHDFETYDEEYLTLSSGGVYIPELPKESPLKRECEHFISSIIQNKDILSDGQNGCDVLDVLIRAQKSLEKHSLLSKV